MKYAQVRDRLSVSAVAPYSVPMYYLFHEGFKYRGGLDVDKEKRYHSAVKGQVGKQYGDWKLQRNRSDWQEALIRDWVELGLNNTHFNIFPQSRKLELSDSHRAAIEDFGRLSAKYGMKVGVRLDAVGDGNYEYWPMHPDNPDNLIDEYLVWVKQVVSLLKGKTAYYVLGDELAMHDKSADLKPGAWTREIYLNYFKRVCGAVKEVDPDAKVSMFATTAGSWPHVLDLLDTEYADIADGVAINHTRYEDIGKFVKETDDHAPDMLFLSNGIGYCSTGAAFPRYPQGDTYYRWPSNETQAFAIAKNMFAWWDSGADTAPYYIYLRNWQIRDRVYPGWYGFFGFADVVVDKYDNLTIKRHPGWYAYQTVAHTFYNRDEFKAPGFEVVSSADLSILRAYEHKVAEGSELLLMLWKDSAKNVSTEITISSKKYICPVRVNLFNYHDWSDVPYSVSDGAVRIKTDVGMEPVIIRFFSYSRP